MFRHIVSISIVFTLGVLLASDIPVMAKTEEENAEIIQRYLDARKWLSCDCAAPTLECAVPCRPREKTAGWICGTPAVQAEAKIRKAMQAGLLNSTIVSMIERQPAPFTPIVVLRNFEWLATPMKSNP
jgi:hypothetical protein